MTPSVEQPRLMTTNSDLTMTDREIIRHEPLNLEQLKFGQATNHEEHIPSYKTQSFPGLNETATCEVCHRPLASQENLTGSIGSVNHLCGRC